MCVLITGIWAEVPEKRLDLSKIPGQHIAQIVDLRHYLRVKYF